MQRIEYIDTAKGICIILVVAYHCSIHAGQCLDTALSNVRMPLYFFLSGFFFKTYGSWFNLLRKKTNKLLVPFLFFYVTTSVIFPAVFHDAFGVQINTVCGWASTYAFIWPEEFPNLPIWFLWSLFLANMLFCLIADISRNKYWLTALITFVIGSAGYAMKFYETDLPAFIDTTCYYIPFFCIGYGASKSEILSRDFGKAQYWCLSVSLLIICILFANIKSGILPFNVLLFYTSCTSGIAFVLMLSKQWGRVPLITYYGRYSIMILVTHVLVIRACRRFLEPAIADADICSVATLLCVMLISLMLIPIMHRYIPWFVAQKDLI